MVTIKDVANRLGLAISTVSKGLNNGADISEETRQLVLDTAVEMGYLSRKMRKRRKTNICILIKNMNYDSIEQFCYDIIVGFKLAAVKRQWGVSVIPIDDEIQKKNSFHSYIEENRFSGAFLLGFTELDTWFGQLSNTDVPVILLDSHVPEGAKHGYVGTDSYESVKLAVEHLFNLNHKRIALLDYDVNSIVSRKRYNSFLQVLEEFSLPIDQALIAFCPDCGEAVEAAVKNFISANATAIICGSDVLAAHTMSEIHKLGLFIPKDISIIGYDDIPLSGQLKPPLTTIRQDRTGIGKSAFFLLDGLMNGLKISKMVLHPLLVERSSTGFCSVQNENFL